MTLFVAPYDNYFDIHNEWIDRLPSSWDEKRVKDLFRLVTDIAPDNNNFELLSLYASIGVRPRKDLEARGNKASSTDGYWMVKKGDIVVNKLLAWMGAIGLSNYVGATSPAYDILRKLNPKIEERYFAYLFRTENAQQIFKRHSRGIMNMRLRLYFDKLGAITVPVPPFSTQQAITDYLDTKTAQLDRKIDLLSQKAIHYGKLKQSLINETVTRGLDKTVPMKNSGVEWIGEVPEHWEVLRIKDIAKSTNGGAFKNDLVENGIPIVKIQQLTLNSEASDFCNPNSSKIKKNNLLKKGDLVFSWSTLISPFIYKGKDALLNQHIFKITHSSHTNRKWLFYKLVQSSRRLMVFAHGSTMQHILKSDFDNLEVETPLPSEQKAIANYLDEKTTQIDRIVSTINTQIEKLKELRKTLINDVVTSKIKVVKEGQVA